MNRFISHIHSCNVVELNRIHNPAGNITIIQNGEHQPFNVRRVYYLYDVPGGSDRGGHAHKELYQLIVAASGSFDVILDDGRKQEDHSTQQTIFWIIGGTWNLERRLSIFLLVQYVLSWLHPSMNQKII